MENLESLKPGDRVTVVNADGDTLPKRALGPVTAGGSFNVVWACREEEWQAALAEGREPDGIPWPARDVSVEEAVRA
jgi:hypothetical protein